MLQLVRRLSPFLPILRARSASLGDQLERVLISVPLKLAEGAYSRGKNRHARYQSAAASAREALACLETAEALGWLGPLEPELGALFQQVIGGSTSRGAEQFGSAGSIEPAELEVHSTVATFTIGARENLVECSGDEPPPMSCGSIFTSRPGSL